MNKDPEEKLSSEFSKTAKLDGMKIKNASLSFLESSALKSIRKLTESSSIASLALQESTTMKHVRELSESSRLASIALQESPAMKSILDFTESSKLTSITLQESPAMKSVREFTESSRLSSITLQESPAITSILDFTEASKLASIALQESPAMQVMKQLSELPSVEALKTLNNSPLDKLITGLEVYAQSIPDSSIVVDEYLSELEREIVEDLSLSDDFFSLSEKTQEILLYIYHHYLLPVLLSCLATVIMFNALEAQKELHSASSVDEVKSIVKHSVGNFDRALLKGYRVTIGDNLYLRELPNKKSNIIETLPVGTLVEVINNDGKSWLLVEVDINGEFQQGWVFRRYTTYFK